MPFTRTNWPQGSGGGAAGKDGKDGATFTPNVSSEGVLSWTNNGGKANPEPVNIKGPKGDKGDKGDSGEAAYKELTQAEYDALTETEKTDGTIYFITDVNSSEGGTTSVPYDDTEIKAVLASKANDADLSNVAKSGSYNDLSDTPTIPAAYDDTALKQRVAALEELVEDMSTEWRGVEYLESHAKPNNNQYIDLGYYATENTRVVMDMQLLENTPNGGGHRIMGTQVDAPRFRFGTFSGIQYMLRYAGLDAYNVGYGSYIPTDRHTFEVGRYFKIDGATINDFGEQTFTTDNPLLLFAINDGTIKDNAHMRLYSCKIYEGDELVRDLAPARHKLFGYVGLYDKVDGEFYENKGTGSFEAGADTSEKW